MYDILFKQYKEYKIDIVDLTTAVKRKYITEEQKQNIILIARQVKK
jgi:hypothetical protein